MNLALFPRLPARWTVPSRACARASGVLRGARARPRHAPGQSRDVRLSRRGLRGLPHCHHSPVSVPQFVGVVEGQVLRNKSGSLVLASESLVLSGPRLRARAPFCPTCRSTRRSSSTNSAPQFCPFDNQRNGGSIAVVRHPHGRCRPQVSSCGSGRKDALADAASTVPSRSVPRLRGTVLLRPPPRPAARMLARGSFGCPPS